MSIDLTRLAKDLGIYPGKHVWPKYEPLLARFASRMLEEAARSCDKRANIESSEPARTAAIGCAREIRTVADQLFQ